MTTSRTVFQLDRAGHYVGEAVADESPLEPGVYLLPAGCIQAAPPQSWPDGQWPRWNGSRWELVTKPAAVTQPDPVAKLQQFLAANPDVAALLQQGSV